MCTGVHRPQMWGLQGKLPQGREILMRTLRGGEGQLFAGTRFNECMVFPDSSCILFYPMLLLPPHLTLEGVYIGRILVILGLASVLSSLVISFRGKSASLSTNFTKKIRAMVAWAQEVEKITEKFKLFISFGASHCFS